MPMTTGEKVGRLADALVSLRRSVKEAAKTGDYGTSNSARDEAIRLFADNLQEQGAVSVYDSLSLNTRSSPSTPKKQPKPLISQIIEEAVNVDKSNRKDLREDYKDFFAILGYGMNKNYHGSEDGKSLRKLFSESRLAFKEPSYSPETVESKSGSFFDRLGSASLSRGRANQLAFKKYLNEHLKPEYVQRLMSGYVHDSLLSIDREAEAAIYSHLDPQLQFISNPNDENLKALYEEKEKGIFDKGILAQLQASKEVKDYLDFVEEASYATLYTNSEFARAQPSFESLLKSKLVEIGAIKEVRYEAMSSLRTATGNATATEPPRVVTVQDGKGESFVYEVPGQVGGADQNQEVLYSTEGAQAERAASDTESDADVAELLQAIEGSDGPEGPPVNRITKATGSIKTIKDKDGRLLYLEKFQQGGCEGVSIVYEKSKGVVNAKVFFGTEDIETLSKVGSYNRETGAGFFEMNSNGITIKNSGDAEQIVQTNSNPTSCIGLSLSNISNIISKENLGTLFDAARTEGLQRYTESGRRTVEVLEEGPAKFNSVEADEEDAEADKPIKIQKLNPNAIDYNRNRHDPYSNHTLYQVTVVAGDGQKDYLLAYDPTDIRGKSNLRFCDYPGRQPALFKVNDSGDFSITPQSPSMGIGLELTVKNIKVEDKLTSEIYNQIIEPRSFNAVSSENLALAVAKASGSKPDATLGDVAVVNSRSASKAAQKRWQSAGFRAIEQPGTSPAPSSKAAQSLAGKGLDGEEDIFERLI